MPLRILTFPRTDNVFGALLVAIALVVYLFTFAPSVGFMDAGELSSVAATLGIAHPTGYPLFTLLAACFAKIPIGVSVVWRLNLLAALCSAGAVFFFFRFFLVLLSIGSRTASRGSVRVAAATGALGLAFSRVFWEQSVGVEVYSLHLLLIGASLFLFVDNIFGTKKNRTWLLFAYCLGLSFANHMTTVLLLPGIVVAYFAVRGSGSATWAGIASALPLFLLGVSPYLYLPIRAAADPVFNWGDPDALWSFWRHVTGRQYSVWMFASFDEVMIRLRSFLAELPGIFGWVALLAAGIGLTASYRREERSVLTFTLLLFVVCVAYAVNYDIDDIESYFLLAYAAMAYWIARGALVLLVAADGKGFGKFFFAALAISAFFVVPALAMNYRALDRSGDHAVEDFARNTFASMEPRATLVTSRWQDIVSPAWYLQTVEGLRPDVIVLDARLLERGWYVVSLRNHHPELALAVRDEMDAYLRVSRAFQQGRTYDTSVAQAAFMDMVRALMRAAAQRGPLYITAEIEQDYLQGFRGLPAGLVFRLSPEDVPPPASVFPEFSIRPIVEGGRYYDYLRTEYATAYTNMAWLRLTVGETAAARALLSEAFDLVPGFASGVALLRTMPPAAP